MNSRERVLCALTRRGLPDRVPLQFDLSRAVAEEFARRLGIPTHYTTAWYEDITYRISNNDLRVAMGSDCVVVGMGLPRGYRHRVDSRGYVVNEFGLVMRQGPLYMEIIEHPLSDIEEVAQAAAFPLPDPLADGRYDDAMRDIRKYHGQYFIIGDIELTVYALARELVGMEKLLADMALGKPYVEVLFDRCMEFMLAAGRQLVAMGVDGIWCGDDFGSQAGLLISPRMWRRYFKERYRRVYAELKAVNPHVLIMQHSDGAMAPILDDWIEVGMEVFNPVQPGVPGHDPATLKARFGDRLSFWGGIDQQYLLPFGTPAQIIADVHEKIAVLGQGGGYMVAPAHVIQPDTPPENVEALIAAVRACSKMG